MVISGQLAIYLSVLGSYTEAFNLGETPKMHGNEDYKNRLEFISIHSIKKFFNNNLQE